MAASKRPNSSFADRNKIKPEEAGWSTASTSKLVDEDVKPKSEPRSTRSPSVTDSATDSKGKAKAEDDDWEQQAAKIEALLAEGQPDEDEDILLATIQANIVGCNKFTGVKTLKRGNEVDLRRDPFNVSDKNAIEVRYPGKGAKIGFLAKGTARSLAPLLDSRSVEVEGRAGDLVPNAALDAAVPMFIDIYGTRSTGRSSRMDFAYPARVRAAEEALKKQKEAAGEQKSKLEEEDEDVEMDADQETFEFDFSGSNTPSKGKFKAIPQQLDMLMADSIRLEAGDRPSGDMLAEMFKEGAMDPSRLPIHPCPPGKKDKSMRTDLMDFQKQGLAWMINMEHPQLPKTIDDPPTQLWVMRKDSEDQTFWYNVATGDSQRDKPSLKRGGILADEMGLGKTMQTISLICTDDTGEGVLETPEEPDERFDDMTLIVCPLSVASNWTVQFHHHVGSKRLKWHLYHGEGRDLTKKQLRKFDVVIATYQTVAAEISEVKPGKRSVSADGEPDPKKAKKVDDTLHQVKWRRIVLDEGHVIKNPKAKMSMAVASLKAERRWILTGTPIVNSTRDLGAMIGFVRLCKPLDDASKWHHYLGDGKDVTKEQARVLRAIVTSTTLRRTKAMTDSSGRLLVKLPEITFYLHKVKLDPTTRALYDEIAGQLKDIVEGFVSTGKVGMKYSDLLTYLLRLRQLACDPTLCPQSFIDDVRRVNDLNKPSRELTPAELNKKDLQDTLRHLLASSEVCTICDELPTEPRITVCGHLFCQQCIEDHVDEKAGCPVCRYVLDSEDIIEPDPFSESVSVLDEAEVLERQRVEGVGAGSSAKTEQLIKFLKASESGVKSLVFSQWTTHLNCIEAALTNAGIVSCKFDGSMTQTKREELIKTFSAPVKPNKKVKKGDKGPPTVMLISLKAGALGLNLTCASQVFLMDPWWQASIEAQAIDRVYRIGQEKPVRVFQLVAEDTVEDRVLDVQKQKDKLISQAFSGNKTVIKKNEKIESRLNDIQTIFGL